MGENRRLKRQLLRHYLWVFNRENNLLIGHVGDITTEGVMLVSKELIVVGKIIQFRMEPFKIETSRFKTTEGREVECTGICVWSKDDVNPGFYVAGFKLDKLEEEEKDFIYKLISEAKY